MSHDTTKTLNKKCTPCGGTDKPFTNQEEDLYMAYVPEWKLDRDSIHRLTRLFVCKSFRHAFTIAARVAQEAEEQGHHPTITIDFKKICFELYTHKIGGLSQNDFIMANIIDRLLEKTEKEPHFDSITTIDSLKKAAKNFSDERDWRKFHSAKNLSMSIATEAAELMEHFIWSTTDESDAIVQKKHTEIGEEFADILLGLLIFADRYDIDITTIFTRKLTIIKEKYPIEKSKGKNNKYTDYIP